MMASVEVAFDEGLLVESSCAELLRSSGQAQALQHAYVAERQAVKVRQNNAL